MARSQPPLVHSLDPSDVPETLAESLSVLSEYRLKGKRDSNDVVERGEKVLSERGALRRMGEEVWPFLEQLGFAALDTGKTTLATICVERLQEKFPNSPRVDALHGLLLELESPTKAREFYEKQLAEDENSLLVRKRLIALHLHSPYTTTSANNKGKSLSVQKGIELLIEHLEVVYNDPEAWSELASAYERLGMLQQSLSCLSDLILLQPTNTFHALRHAETLYSLSSYPLAYRGFCRVLEMSGSMAEGGLGRRAGFGIKMCLKRMEGSEQQQQHQDGKSSAVVAQKGKREEIEGPKLQAKRGKDIDALVTQELLKAYARAWTDLGDRVAGHDETKVLRLWLARQASQSTAVVTR